VGLSIYNARRSAPVPLSLMWCGVWI